MKVDFGAFEGTGQFYCPPERLVSHVLAEADRLTDVILCPPDHLAPVPCCTVTRRHIDQGFATSSNEAQRQHAALVATLEGRGIRCHMLQPSADLPDMCFTRDIGVSTPWGMVALNPAMPHRRGEVDALVEACGRWGLPIRRISRGMIEGGDICVAREGLLIVGLSGERSSAAGIDEFARPFRAAGWEVLVCPFHADHLHLDTIFCMIDRHEAIGCVDLLDPAFIRAIEERGIAIRPMPAAFAASLGCNILALGDKRILASSADDLVVTTLRAADYEVLTLDISQFAACGGGIHCLTQPLRRLGA
ncbi:dimethylarginine dimethylaminohydrolase family protein [Sphingobium bisphenolivorans]|uniref:dimethylarginine dimethylaminohydrolase family protein n=1 Tax=Sphingobium bisphenolivorans TaxID=1335760 RepID=UPI0019309522|nr:arginine deiminase family protein [Sphingobium bisphenolivorans]